MSEKPIFAVERLTKSYQNKKPVLNDVSLVFHYGAKIGVIGQNGAGKSTTMKVDTLGTRRQPLAPTPPFLAGSTT